MVLRVFIFLISICIVGVSFGQAPQALELRAIRVGFDPLKSSTLLFPEKNPNAGKNKYYLTGWESSLELIGPYRTTFEVQYGMTGVHLQEKSGTLNYFSKGHYVKLGLDFNLTEPNTKYEFDIGWRLGIGRYADSGFARLKGDYYNNEYRSSLRPHTGSMLWGEILMDFKQKLFPNSKMSGLWIGTELSFRFTNAIGSLNTGRNGQIHTYFIPGYGLSNPIMVGGNISLTYYFNIKHKVLNELRHEHYNDIHYHQHHYHH